MATCFREFERINHGQSNSSLLISPKQTKTKNTLFVFLSILLIVLVVLWNNQNGQNINLSKNDIFVAQDTNSKASDDRTEIVIDDIFGSDVDDLSFGSNEWINFHNQLLIDNGYDLNDESNKYVFKLYDDDDSTFDEADDENMEKTKRKRKRAKMSGLSCFSKYSFVNSGPSIGDNGYLLSLECDADSVMTGCISFSFADQRSGEKPEPVSPNTQKCSSFALQSDWVGLGIRCCSPNSKKNKIEIGISQIESYPHSFAQSWSANAFCKDVGITDHNFYSSKDYVIVGCSAWTGIDSAFQYIAAPSPGTAEKTMTKQMIGSQVTATMIGSVNNGICSAHRGDEEGFISAQAIAAHIESSDDEQLDCRTVISKTSTLSGNVWVSKAVCPKQYVNVDCNAFVYGHMDSCDDKIDSKHKTYGGRFNSKNGCETFGTSELIRAQSICCRIR